MRWQTEIRFQIFTTTDPPVILDRNLRELEGGFVITGIDRDLDGVRLHVAGIWSVGSLDKELQLEALTC